MNTVSALLVGIVIGGFLGWRVALCAAKKVIDDLFKKNTIIRKGKTYRLQLLSGEEVELDVGNLYR